MERNSGENINGWSSGFLHFLYLRSTWWMSLLTCFLWNRKKKISIGRQHMQWVNQQQLPWQAIMTAATRGQRCSEKGCSDGRLRYLYAATKHILTKIGHPLYSMVGKLSNLYVSAIRKLPRSPPPPPECDQLLKLQLLVKMCPILLVLQRKLEEYPPQEIKCMALLNTKGL